MGLCNPWFFLDVVGRHVEKELCRVELELVDTSK